MLLLERRYQCSRIDLPDNPMLTVFVVMQLVQRFSFGCTLQLLEAFKLVGNRRKNPLDVPKVRGWLNKIFTVKG